VDRVLTAGSTPPEGYRTHLAHGVHCDERACEACIHNCDCARCDPWCYCDPPPNPILPGGEMRFSDDGRLTETGLLALADELAEALGPPWIHDKVGHHYYRTHLASPDDGWRIALNVDRGRHKAVAVGLTPTLEGRWWRDAKQASIGFTATRDPDAIAADMRRRLFPAYAQALGIERRGIEQERDRRERFAHAAARLGSHLPGDTAKDLSVRNLRFDKYWTDRHGSYNVARLSGSSRTVALDLHGLPLDVACSVIDLIEGRNGARRRPRQAGTAARRHARRRGRTVKARRP